MVESNLWEAVSYRISLHYYHRPIP